MTRVHRSSSPWTGIVLVIVGCLFLFNNLDIINLGDFFSDYWPVIIILVGLIKLGEHDKSGAIFLIVVGGFLLSVTLDVMEWDDLFRFWPLILVLIGISMILKIRSPREQAPEIPPDPSGSKTNLIHEKVIFGELHRAIFSDNLRGGEIQSIFGSCKIDLSAARPVTGCRLNLTAIFGEVTVTVSPDVQVTVSSDLVLGEVKNFSTGQSASKQIHCHCSGAFGGIIIKS
jgi:predicted membrane protein